jgi:type IV secretory pathway TrbD component
VNLFRFIPGYQDQIYEAGREPILVALLAFLICFALTRGYTRIARVRGWGSASAGGVHLHHVVVGIVLALVSATLIIGFEPIDSFFELFLCAVFGSGAALILDEFALVFRLQDVYWAEEGRSSIDAVIVALVVGLIVFLHLTPVDTDDSSSRWVLTAVVLIHALFVFVVVLKGKFWTALFAVFIPLVALIASIRLAKPDSLWARKFYREGSRRRRHSESRYRKKEERWGERREHALDLIGGAPSAPEAEPE